VTRLEGKAVEALRVLIASDFYPPFIGGLERQSAMEARELAARGHEVTVATIWHPGLPETETDQGVRISRLKGIIDRLPWLGSVPNRRFHPPFPDPGIVLGLRRLVRERGIEVVNGTGWIAYSCAGAVAGTGVPLVVSVRDNGYGCAVRTLVRYGRPCDGPGNWKCLKCAGHQYGAAKGATAVLGVRGRRRWLARRTSAFHCISRYVKMTLERDVLSGGRTSKPAIALMPDMVDAARAGDTDAGGTQESGPQGLPAAPYILFVGAIHRNKGVDTLLSAYRRLSSPPPLVLIGTLWPDSPTEFPAGVQVLTDLPHAEVMRAWSRCLFGVAPSVTPEGFGDVVVEAMSTGKAVIGSTLGGHRDSIEPGVTGLLVEPGDTAGLTNAMRLLIDDVDLRNRLGEQGRLSSARCRPAAVVPQFEMLFRRVVGPRR
jgi:glycosyltransferase involved in cell wall biosynthesis